MKNKYLLLIAPLFFAACEKIILGTDEENNPRNNFEIFWDDFDKHYGLFQARGWNWDSIYTVYSPQVTAQTTDGELWITCTEMIKYLDDGHTGLADPDKRISFSFGSELDEITEEELSLELIDDKYLEYSKSASEVIDFYYGKIMNKDIGYIYLGNMDYENPSKIDDILQEIGSHKAIIFDIRNNTGGTDEFSERVASFFADGKHLIYTVEERNGPKHDDFGAKIPYYTKVNKNELFLKPVIVLTDRITVSAADVFLLHMKSFNHVIQMGDSTAGDFSDISMQRFLPNGWIYQYSIMMYLLPDGTSLDGIGHIPDVYIKNSTSDIETGNDLVIEKAIQYLFDEYGIE